MKMERLSKFVVPILILLVLAIAVFANLIAVTATEKFSLKLDLTDNKLYELSDMTREITEGIVEPTVITVFAGEADYPVMIKEILGAYNGLSSNIVVEYKDPYENPVLVDSLRQKGISLAENDIVINGRNNLKHLKIDDLYVFNASKTEVKSLKAEQAITSALLYVNSNIDLSVLFTDGHGERPSAALMELFSENNFEVGRVALGVMGIDKGTDLVVIAAPERDFQVDEIAKLEAYLEAGGKMLVFVEPSERNLPNFENFMLKWGIGLTDNVVYEEKAYLSNNPVNIVPMYAPHPVNTYFGDKRFFLVSPATRALKKADRTEYQVELMPVLVSSPGSFGKAGTGNGAGSRTDGDSAGPFILALSSVREVAVDGEKVEAKVLAIGSRNFFSDDILGRSSYANSEFLVQAVNWLVEKDTSISIPAKNVAPDPINVLPDTVWLIGIIFVGVIPAVIIITGFVVCMRRKRL